MPNHVHALICPAGDLSKLVSGIEVTSAKEANRLLSRTGAFRSRDYFDRCARNSAEERRIMSYIENNPVKAGLCRDASAWAYSSASGSYGNAAGSRISMRIILESPLSCRTPKWAPLGKLLAPAVPLGLPFEIADAIGRYEKCPDGAVGIVGAEIAVFQIEAGDAAGLTPGFEDIFPEVAIS